MENNSDRMGFALIALSVVAFVLLAVNGPLKSTVEGFFNGFNHWQTQTFNGINESNKQDVTHTAYSWSSDGTDRFTITKPNLNLLDGTRDFSGTWDRAGSWTNDGTYKGLTVKKKTASMWDGINKTFVAPKDGDYTFSAYVKSSGNTANVYRYGGINSTQASLQKQLGNNFDWIRDTITLNLKANDSVWFRYEISGNGTDSILWNAGQKWEQGSTATPYMPSASEVKPSDQPKYIGMYTDKNDSASQDPTKYTWKVNPDYHE